MMKETIEDWKTSRPTERRSQVCISIPPTLMDQFKKKFPDGNFSRFVELKLRDELER